MVTPRSVGSTPAPLRQARFGFRTGFAARGVRRSASRTMPLETARSRLARWRTVARMWRGRGLLGSVSRKDVKREHTRACDDLVVGIDAFRGVAFRRLWSERCRITARTVDAASAAREPSSLRAPERRCQSRRRQRQPAVTLCGVSGGMRQIPPAPRLRSSPPTRKMTDP